RRGMERLRGMNTWDLLEVAAPDGVRDPVVVVEDDGARAVLLVLQPGQELGEHQVKENAWAVVVDGSVECESADGSRTELTRGTRAERHALRSAEGARLLLILAPWPAADHFQREAVG